jgi:hypothetical protein
MQDPSVNVMNLTSLKDDRSSKGPGFRGGSRLVQHEKAIRQHTKQTKPEIRTDHPKPTSEKSLCSMRGKTIPPKLDPATAMLVAVARSRAK